MAVLLAFEFKEVEVLAVMAILVSFPDFGLGFKVCWLAHSIKYLKSSQETTAQIQAI